MSSKRLPVGIRIYAIGDIHGRADLLRELFEKIDRDLAKRPIERSLVVTLGDYLDRGPASREVIDLLIARKRIQECINLKGNHEVMAVGFLGDPPLLEHWRNFGGVETLKSYGVTLPSADADLSVMSGEWKAKLPADHTDFLLNLTLSFGLGDYFFVHAGVRPGVMLDRQVERDLLWIRNEFLESEQDFGKIIVHGHTPVSKPEFRANRINIDTGAYASGILTCIVLEENQAEILLD